MSKIFFWNGYDKPFRFIFWVLFLLFIALCIGITAIQVVGIKSLIPWNVLTLDTSFASDFLIFSKGPFSFSVTADKKVLNEFFSGGDISTGLLGSELMIAFTGIAMVLYLTLVTLFKRTWYLIAMAGLLIFLIMMNVESTLLFGWSGTKVLILVFVLLLTPSYYLHAFNEKAGFTKRLWVMGLAMVLLIALIYYFGRSSYGFIGMFNFGLLAPYILLLLFIITVAHEIIAGFINVISGSEGIADNTKLRHFLIITVIYLANILLSYLYVAHYIEWQLITINPFVLLVVSSILGVWGSRSRASLYTGASRLEVLWPVLYLVIGVLSLGTLTFILVTVNDPMIRVLYDFIIYSHLAIGIAFLLYILYNFIPIIEKGYAVSKVLYDPQNLPYLTYRLMALLIIIGLFAVRGFEYPVWFSLGGYHNANGDIEKELGEQEFAEAYYQTADAFAYHNHKANYNLAKMYDENKPDEAMKFYKIAAEQWPTSQAVINKANLENNQRDYYKALFTLQEGSNKIENSVYLQNNIAQQFEKVRILDSADYYYNKAGVSNAQVKNNRLAFSASYGRPLLGDSASLFKNLNKAGLANASAYGYIKERPTFKNANHMFDMVLMNNWLLNDNLSVADSSLYQAKTTIDSTSNVGYQDQLKFNWSLAAYKAGNTVAAIEGLSGLAYSSMDWSDRAKLTLGQLYLDMGSYSQAIALLSDALQGNFNLELAVAHLENGTPELTEEFWRKAAVSEMEFVSELGKEILYTLYSENPVFETDQQKYLYGRYNRFFMDESAENELLNSISNKDLRIDLALDLAEFYHNLDNPNGAVQMLKNIEGLALSMEAYRSYILLNARIINTDSNVQQRLVEFDSLFDFRENEYILEATLNHLAGLEQDSAIYLQMAQDNPFIPEAVLIGIDYLKSNPDPYISYSYLAKAVQMNPDSPLLLREYILYSLEVGMDQFAENALSEYSQRFSGQSYLLVKSAYEQKIEEINKMLEMELNE